MSWRGWEIRKSGRVLRAIRLSQIFPPCNLVREQKSYGSVLGLRKEEIEDNGLNGIPDNEDDVGLPANIGKGDRPGELIKKTTGVHC